MDVVKILSDEQIMVLKLLKRRQKWQKYLLYREDGVNCVFLSPGSDSMT